LITLKKNSFIDRYNGAFKVKVAKGKNITLYQVRKAKGETLGD